MIDKNIKIFLLEDLKNDQILIKRSILKGLPHALITIAANRQEFLEKISWLKPDIILSDFNLPDYNGLEALFYVKENLPKVPFIFVSGNLNNEELVAQTIINGASGYLSKDNLSTLPEKLLEIIQQTAEQRKTAEAAQLKITRRNILLKKIQFKLTEAAPFPENEELLDMMNQVLDLEE